MKVGICFETLKKETGCLRVIPGSHHHRLTKCLGPLWRQNDDPNYLAFGLKGEDIPSVSLETELGDLVVFTESVYHASFGSKTPRLLVTVQYAAKPTTEDQIAKMRECYEQHTWSYHPAESFIHSDRSRLRGMVSQLVELGLTTPKLV